MNLVVEKIPHSEQRYPTVGDWAFHTDVLEVKVSDLDNEVYEFLIGIHELVEAYLCKKHGVKEEDVSEFDIAFEAHRLEGNTDESGNHIDAPYRREHNVATIIEMFIAHELGVNWHDYGETVNKLS